MDVEKLNLSAIRTVRVLRPLRAINRIPSNSKLLLTAVILTDCHARYEDPGDVAAGHSAHAGQRPPPLLLRLLHLRDSRSPAVGGTAQTEMLREASEEREICLDITDCSDEYLQRLLDRPGYKE